MKKLLNVILIVILVIMIALFTAPLLFKGKIMEIARIQINNSINAKAEFEDLRISLLKRFPYLSVELIDLSVTGNEPFAGDTLVAFESFGVAADLISAIKGEQIKIKSIVLDQPVINGIVLENGRANWDIAVATEEVEEEPEDTTATEIPDINILLKKFQIKDANITYTDMESGMSADIRKFNFILTGDFSKDFSTLTISSGIASLNFIMDNTTYIKNAPLDLNMAIDADLVENIFTLKNNTFTINDLTLGWDGTFSIPEEAPMDFDLTYYTKETSFKTLLSMVPAIYMHDFSDVQTAGQLSLDGYVKGKYSETIMPNVGLNLVVSDASFKYPDLPESVENIGINVDVFFDGLENDNSTVDVNRFHLEVAENPVDLMLNIRTPVSDMQINGNLTTKMDLTRFADAIPMENTTIKGLIEARLDMMGSMSMIEEERYEEFKADGSVTVNDLMFSSPDIPQAFAMNHAEILFSPRFVEISTLEAGMGKSDFQFTGKLENFVPYALSDGTLQGSFVFTSNILDLNELITSDDEEPVVEDTTDVPMSIIEVPEDLDLTLYSDLNTIYFDNMVISEAKGTIGVRNNRIILDDLALNTLDGRIVLNGEYNTLDPEAPIVDFDLAVQSIEIPAAYKTFNTVEKLAPVAQNLNGSVSASLEFTTFLDSTMTPVYNSMVGEGSLSSKEIKVEKSNTLNKLANTLNTKAFENLSMNDLDLSFEIRNGRVYVDPFDINLGKTTMIISGDQGIDQTLNYNLNIVMPRSGIADAAFTGLTSAANLSGMNLSPSDNISLDVAVGGTFTDPTVKPNLKKSAAKSVENIKQEAISQAKAELEKKKEEVKAKASEQAEKILAKAEQEAQRVQKLGKDAADAIRKEADENAQKLIDQANNPIAKKAAEVSAKKIRQEADKKATKVEQEADEKAGTILERARKEAERLK